MRYVGTRFTASEAEQIRREARAHLRLPDESGVRRPDRRDAGVIYKTRDNARVRKRTRGE